MGKLPFMQFFTRDWLGDPAVSKCTPATRGVLFDLLCAMHEAGRSGELRGTTESLARIARCSTADFVQALTDLETTGAAEVRHRNGDVTVINRRMKREAEAREKAAKRQRKSRSGKGEETPPSQSRHAGVTPPLQTSEFRNHISDSNHRRASTSTKPPDPPPVKTDDGGKSTTPLSVESEASRLIGLLDRSHEVSPKQRNDARALVEKFGVAAVEEAFLESNRRGAVRPISYASEILTRQLAENRKRSPSPASTPANGSPKQPKAYFMREDQ